LHDKLLRIVRGAEHCLFPADRRRNEHGLVRKLSGDLGTKPKRCCQHVSRIAGEPLAEIHGPIMRVVKADQDAADLCAGVLDLVTRPHGGLADVAGFELVDDRISLGKKHTHFCRAADVVLPLVRIRMPVQLAQGSGLQLNYRSCHRG